jgi:uncharacterized membrane protein
LNTQPTYFRTSAIRPLESFSEGWRLIRDQYPLMVGISLVGVIIAGSVPLGILQGPMMCGIYICLFALARGERIEFGTLFKGFDHFMPSLIATLVHLVPVILVLLPTSVAMMVLFALSMGGGSANTAPRPDATTILVGFIGGSLLILLVVLVLTALLLFAYPLIVERRLSGWDACRTSARAALGNAGGVLGLLLLNAAMGFAGLLLCYVGVAFVMPIGFAATAVAYRDVFGEETG